MQINLIMNSANGGISNGMDLYRMAIPYAGVQGHEVTCIGVPEFDANELTADVYVINRSRELFRAEYVKKQGKKLIVDIDDYWQLPTWHSAHPDNLYKQIQWAYEAGNYEKVNKDELKAVEAKYKEETDAPDNIIKSCRIADAVTVSTPKLQDTLLKEYGINSIVISNTIPKWVQQFSTYKNKSNKVRFGWVGGVFHRRDIAMLYNGIRFMHTDLTLRGKYQILSTFENNAEYKEIEKILTCGYKCCSAEYEKYLKRYVRVGEHMGINEAYRRLWAKTPTEYGTMYEDIDVALIPLKHGKFNSHKSELKLIEAGTTGCAAIVSNVEPYKRFLKDGYNCLTTNETNGWYRSMKKLIQEPNLREDITGNLARTIEENFNPEKESENLTNLINSL